MIATLSQQRTQSATTQALHLSMQTPNKKTARRRSLLQPCCSDHYCFMVPPGVVASPFFCAAPAVPPP